MFELTKISLKKRWRQTTNRIAHRVSFMLYNGQSNPDWIVSRMRDEFPEGTECQILTAVAKETHDMIVIFVNANSPLLDQSSNAAIDNWSNTHYVRKSQDYIRLYWPVLRLARSVHYEELMRREYGESAENAARKILQMWTDTSETGPSGREELQNPHESVNRGTPVRIETTIMAFQILFRTNLEDAEFLEHLANGVLYIPFRYNLDEAETLKLFEAWDNFVAECVS